MARPPLVYLDSSDFSSLSTAKEGSELSAIKEELLEMAASGTVHFVFSGVHISEMAPLKAGHATTAAAARADLLVELCGKRTLASFDRLLANELRALAALPIQDFEVLSQNGEWYPDMGESLITPVHWGDTWKTVSDEAIKQGLNREARRKLKSKFIRKGKPTEEARQVLVESEKANSYEDLVRKFPMKLSDAKVIGGYLIGKSSQEEANEALLESMRDPSWMMRWYEEHADQMSFIAQWTREPSAKMKAAVEELSCNAQLVYQAQEPHGGRYVSDTFSIKGWNAYQDEVLPKMALTIFSHFCENVSPPNITAGDVDRHCPGISTFIRSAHSAMRASTLEKRPRSPKASDLVDAVHAIYAPYVDVFRADGFMAEHVAAHCPQSTQVVPKLNDLVPLLRQLTDSQPQNLSSLPTKDAGIP